MRGQLVTIAAPGDYGKPRPALIIQADVFSRHPSTTFLPLTSDLTDRPLTRVTVDPSDSNGLAKPSQVMIDKIQTVSRERVGEPIGRLGDEAMVRVTRALAVFLGFA
jgi:mRNA interferase MazF